MQSSEGAQFAPLNRWYIAAWSHELTRQPFERWILDAPVAFYRTRDGKPVALDGRCPHHLYPLGKSATDGDNIRCGYHGLTFAPDGRCVSSPFMESIPARCRVKSYALAERWKWLWIWPGDPALADEALIPDHVSLGLDDSRYVSFPGHAQEVDARYQLINDNLLDLTHLEVLHIGTAGSAGIGRIQEVREAGGDWVSSFRTMKDVPMPAAFVQLFGSDGLVDRTFGLKFMAPGLHAGYDIIAHGSSTASAGKPIGRFNVYHAVTPARRHTSNYFVAVGRDFRIDDEKLTEQMKGALRNTLNEDTLAVTQVERMLQASNSPGELLFKSDATLVTGRRILESLIRAEHRPG